MLALTRLCVFVFRRGREKKGEIREWLKREFCLEGEVMVIVVVVVVVVVKISIQCKIYL